MASKLSTTTLIVSFLIAFFILAEDVAAREITGVLGRSEEKSVKLDSTDAVSSSTAVGSVYKRAHHAYYFVGDYEGPFDGHRPRIGHNRPRSPPCTDVPAAPAGDKVKSP
ncbi:hypothetical protein CJ030_MR4G020647 [Morella rubra]|uniref:Uncharacterized protein n=1 Tax=Morella rubra TaxID=262757 RepID=A0A6A1VV16_9ROSI|nr:hypothetical protein CJ030_MR4G020647 [Morella rubra]